MNGLSRLEFTDFPKKELQKIIDSMDFTNIWEDIWTNINNPWDAIQAIFKSLVAIYETLGQIGRIIESTFGFVFMFIKWLFENLIIILQFLGYYLGLITG